MPLIKSSNSGPLAKDALVLDLGDLHRQGEAIIAQARGRAAQIIANGTAERERLISDATELGRQAGLGEGRAQGLADGREAGRQEALQQAGAELAAISAGWERALDALVGERQRLLMEARTEVVRLAVQIAERITKRAIALDPSVVADQLQATLALVIRPSRVVVAVHPEDRALLERALPEIVKRFAAVEHVELVEDAGLERGSCVARLGEGKSGSALGGGGEIDASIAVQLDRVVEALLPGQGTAAPGDQPGGSAA